ncbi:MAG: sigma-54-dependent Fis family transcriptional regulator [Deltaproteobacteria bacterium]|nr:sigma-54-dependent Fis family transcriptional regulator [Deltaproteobacteria bacterium]
MKNNTQILIVDDEKDICGILRHIVREEGFKSIVAGNGELALELVRSERPDVMLLDVRMPKMDGMEVLAQAKELEPNLPVIMITGSANIRGAVKAMRAGAHDYLAKPFENEEVIRVVHRALAERELKEKVRPLSSQLEESGTLKDLMGPSDAVTKLISMVKRVSSSDFAVIIQGETGAGKELIATTIHRVSQRSAGPFVPVDCGAIPETLLESELFGHEKGAFTGAIARKLGKFELAESGTLFLDEISNMPLKSQAKLLRALQDKKFYRVGGSKPIEVDVRMLVATNENLYASVESGSFRRDLFFRLSDFAIAVPSLRKRKDDIPYLAKRFLDSTNKELNKKVTGFSESAVEAILIYPWPGNVRELRSCIRRAVLLADDVISESHLGLKAQKGAHAPGLGIPPCRQEACGRDGRPLKEVVRQSTMAVERRVILKTLSHTGGNKARAARLLHIDYKTIHTKIKQLGININGRQL